MKNKVLSVYDKTFYFKPIKKLRLNHLKIYDFELKYKCINSMLKPEKCYISKPFTQTKLFFLL